ncbi:MAG: glycosyltransferase family 39 protein [Planctomycetes bacterium]|nr:glycosyltransferase family 39 protein [Planctomycetota bacterium]
MKVRFSIWLMGLVALSLAFQALLLQQAWAENPFARVLLGDSAVYWEWAGEIANGKWIADEPFQSAPLYPYFLALLRTLGLDLLGVYSVQALLGTLTMVLIALATRRRAGPLAGLIAATLWIFLDEAAFVSGRIWNLPLQLFTGSLLLWYTTRIPEQFGKATLPSLGALCGIAVLANPALLPVVLLLIFWAGQAPIKRNLFGSFTALAVMAVCIAPATYHNREACGETILISSQAGLTFAHGNSAGASGTYYPVEGVSENRRTQNQDAVRLVEQETGKRSWKATSRYFFERGLGWMVENPGDVLSLELRKAWWLLTGRSYADLYNPDLESRTEFGSRLTWAPISLAFLFPLALFGMVRVWRREGLRHRGPEILMIGGVALIVLVFWYSPRYRMPLAPAVILLAAEGMAWGWGSWREEQRRGPGIIVLSLMAIALVAGLINRATRFDSPDLLMPAFLHSVGDSLRLMEGREAESIEYLESAIERGYRKYEAHYSLALAYMKLAETTLNDGQEGAQKRALPTYHQAVTQLRQTVEHDPNSFQPQFNLASIEFWFWQLGEREAWEVQPLIERALQIAQDTGSEEPAARLQQMLAQL